MNFFFDRCMPRRLAHMIDVYDIEHTVRHHDDDPRFHERTEDVDWMRALAEDDPPWVVVSGDLGIIRNSAEREVLREVNLTFFYLTKQWTKNLSFHEFAWRFLKVWPEIVKNADPTSPRVFEIAAGKAAKVTLIGPTKD
jgi:hypothetical protein